jgi:hypothetical protein
MRYEEVPLVAIGALEVEDAVEVGLLPFHGVKVPCPKALTSDEGRRTEKREGPEGPSQR